MDEQPLAPLETALVEEVQVAVNHASGIAAASASERRVGTGMSIALGTATFSA